MCSNVFVYGEDNIRVKDRQLVKVLLAAAKKAFTTKWEWEDIPTQDQWTHLVEEICTMEMIMHCLKLREAQFDKRWTINVTEQRQNTGLD